MTRPRVTPSRSNGIRPLLFVLKIIVVPLRGVELGPIPIVDQVHAAEVCIAVVVPGLVAGVA